MENAGMGNQGSQQSGGTTAPPVGEQVGEMAGQVQEQVGRLTDQVRSQVSSNLMEQKDRAASGLETVSLVLRQTGDQFRQQDQAAVAQYVDSAAQQVERFSDQLRTQDLTQIVQETERFARRQPWLFAGAAATVGFLAVRFLRSSQPQQNTSGYYPMTTGASYGGDVYEPGFAGRMAQATSRYGSGASGVDSTTGYGAGMGSTSGYGSDAGMGSTSDFGGGASGLGSTSGLDDTMGHSSMGTGFGDATDELAVDIDLDDPIDAGTTGSLSGTPTDDRTGRETL